MKDHRPMVDEIGDAFRVEMMRRNEDLFNRKMDRWREAVGDDLTPLLQSAEVALRHAKEKSGNEKRVAIQVLSSHWNLGTNPRFVALLRNVIASNERDDVREAAILAIGLAYRLHLDIEWLSSLAHIVVDNSQSPGIQRAAYGAMRGITGLAVPYSPSQPRGSRVCQFPADVDWGFVVACLNLDDRADLPPVPLFDVTPSPWEAECLIKAGTPFHQTIHNRSLTIEWCDVAMNESENWAVYSIRARLHLLDSNWCLAIVNADASISLNSRAFEPMLTNALAHAHCGNDATAQLYIKRYHAARRLMTEDGRVDHD